MEKLLDATQAYRREDKSCQFNYHLIRGNEVILISGYDYWRDNHGRGLERADKCVEHCAKDATLNYEELDIQPSLEHFLSLVLHRADDISVRPENPILADINNQVDGEEYEHALVDPERVGHHL